MKSFKTIYEEVIYSLINEGGNAIPGVDRIEKATIFKTIDDFKNKILKEFFGYVPKDEMFLLGSTGKKKDSGDIDIGIDVNALKEKNIILNLIKMNEICARNGYNSCINSINYKMVHIAYPQIGEEPKKVQIDVLFTESPDFTKFFMFSPEENESRYKGAHRNALIHAILYCISYKEIKSDEDGQPVKWEQMDIQDDGIFRQVKTLIDENGNRLLYKNTDEPLEPAYAKVEQEVKICDDVSSAIEMFAGENVTEQDINSFEKFFKFIDEDARFKYKNLKNEIFTKCAKDLFLAKNRLDFPEELRDYLKV